MREILFRGISRETKKPVLGMLMYSVSDSGLVIVETVDCPPTMSDPCGDTVNIYHGIIQGSECKFTGLTDKNGTKIFEDDIVLYCKEERMIVFDCGSWGIQAIDRNTCEGQWIGRHVSLYLNNMESEVIGAIYDKKQED